MFSSFRNLLDGEIAMKKVRKLPISETSPEERETSRHSTLQGSVSLIQIPILEVDLHLQHISNCWLERLSKKLKFACLTCYFLNPILIG